MGLMDKLKFWKKDDDLDFSSEPTQPDTNFGVGPKPGAPGEMANLGGPDMPDQQEPIAGSGQQNQASQDNLGVPPQDNLGMPDNSNLGMPPRQQETSPAYDQTQSRPEMVKPAEPVPQPKQGRHEMEMINLKLDAIRNTLENINIRLERIEHLAKGEQHEKRMW